MPNRDQSGPNGEGPRSGYGTGKCAGEGGAGRPNNRGFGRGQRGFGRNRGQGRGRGQGNRGNSWVSEQLNALQSALEKLTEKVDGMSK